MKIAIMQPYFLPYIGYFQLINAVEKFVVYDNIEYSKKGWINRNRYLQNNKDYFFTIPIKKNSDYSHIVDLKISESYKREKILNKFNNAYRKAPYFRQNFPILEKIISYSSESLFHYILYSINTICNILEIKTEIIVSSNIDIDHNLKSEKKIIEICKKLNSKTYLNSSGGIKIYSKEYFKKFNIDLIFLESLLLRYSQFNNEKFVPCLSIVDVLMFNSVDIIKLNLNKNLEFK